MGTIKNDNWVQENLSWLGEGCNREVYTFTWKNPHIEVVLHPRLNSEGWMVTCEALGLRMISLPDAVKNLKDAKLMALLEVSSRLSLMSRGFQEIANKIYLGDDV